jgi:hypothetical protein
VKDGGFRSLVLMAALVSLTWPVAVAHAALRYIFTRPYVADAAAALAVPASAAIACVVAAISCRRPSNDPIAWVVRCALSGALVGDLWLACGAYVHAQRSADVLWRTMIGGLLYGGPVGLVAGMGLGAELVVLQRWSERGGSWRRGWPFVLTSVFLNALCGIGLWYGADAMRRHLGWSGSDRNEHVHQAPISTLPSRTR